MIPPRIKLKSFIILLILSPPNAFTASSFFIIGSFFIMLSKAIKNNIGRVNINAGILTIDSMTFINFIIDDKLSFLIPEQLKALVLLHQTQPNQEALI